MMSGDNEGKNNEKRQNQGTQNRIFGMSCEELDKQFNDKKKTIGESGDGANAANMNPPLIGARQRSFMDEESGQRNRAQEQKVSQQNLRQVSRFLLQTFIYSCNRSSGLTSKLPNANRCS